MFEQYYKPVYRLIVPFSDVFSLMNVLSQACLLQYCGVLYPVLSFFVSSQEMEGNILKLLSYQ